METNIAIRRTTGHPILPAELFSQLYDLIGDASATEILDRVQEGRVTVTEVQHALENGQIYLLLSDQALHRQTIVNQTHIER